ncbi:MAG: preprotein translocase subunit SecG [Isosphaerales bacterium]
MDILLGFLNVVIVILTVFLVGIILIQRGKGGGLAGAFGGMGGSSAFGTRTGDVFTKITVGVAIAWILLSMLMVVLTNRRHSSAFVDSSAAFSKDLDSKSTKSGAKSRPKGRDEASLPGALPSSNDLELPVGLPPDIPVPAVKSTLAEKPTLVEKPAQVEKSTPAPKK